MLKMGFDSKWVDLTLNCVCSVKFSVLINGKPGKHFRPSRGLRQGDPLSPYLFLIVSEALSSMIHEGCEAGFIQGLKISRNGPNISHIFFADDSLIFLRANPINCTNMLSILRSYCMASGQVINMEKSICFFSSNSPPDVKTSICNLLGMRVVENPGTYLGLPTLWGRSKKGALQYVKDRISGKMHGWKNLLLSQAGKEVLIKAVVQAIPAYPMSVFKFPITFCHELDSSIGNFWWGQSNGSNKVHWLSWENMGLAKIEGGMGFRNFSEFNNALLAAQGWRLLMHPNSLWASILRDKYFPNGDVLNAKKGARASWGWSSILEGIKVISRGAQWQVINGQNISLWHDRWLHPSIDNQPLCPLNIEMCKEVRVATIIDPDTRSWNLDSIRHLISPRVEVAICSTPIGSSAGVDRVIWPLNRHGQYSVKSGYHFSRNLTNQSNVGRPSASRMVDKKIWKVIWHSKTLPKIRHFLWRAVRNSVATKANLASRRIPCSSICPICEVNSETVEHALLTCPWVVGVWFGSPLGYVGDRQQVTSLDRWILSLISLPGSSKNEVNRVVTMMSFIMWSIWKARCKAIFEHKPPDPGMVIQDARNSWTDFLSSIPRVGAINSDAEGDYEVVRSTIWQVPPAPYLKLNVDAAWFSSSGYTGIGIIIRDHQGEFKSGKICRTTSISAVDAEARAVIEGLSFAANQGYSHICVESDSKPLINCCLGKITKGAWELYPSLGRIQELKSNFTSVRWEWVPREANAVADAAAAFAIRGMGTEVWVDRPPSSLVHVLSRDGLPCPP
ncbi:hypothetical protein CerSpe_014650 [Prunus speciosa]